MSPIWDSAQTGAAIGPGFRVGQPRTRAAISLPVADMARRDGGTKRPRAIPLAVLSHGLLEEDGFERHPHQGRRPGPGGTDDGISEHIHGRPSSAGLLSACGTGDGVRGVAPGRAPPRHALAQKPPRTRGTLEAPSRRGSRQGTTAKRYAALSKLDCGDCYQTVPHGGCARPWRSVHGRHSRALCAGALQIRQQAARTSCP